MLVKPSSEPVLQAEEIYKSFHGIKVLEGISLTAHKHDVISIIGASGSGKSTFLRCLNMLETPDSGRLWVHGEALDLAALKDGVTSPALRRQVERTRTHLGMVFQQFNLWSHMTVLEN
ncbi:MAG TPA: ATP-binding cassette domain-containing protein, partial [Motiliproteus sp.]